MSECSWAMVVAPDGPLRESLRALVTAIPLAGVVSVDDASSGLEMLGSCQPGLLVIDFDPNDPKVWKLLAEASRQRPPIRHLLLVDTEETQHAALEAGARVVLLKGFPASRLSAVIRQLLPMSNGDAATPMAARREAIAS